MNRTGDSQMADEGYHPQEGLGRIDMLEIADRMKQAGDPNAPNINPATALLSGTLSKRMFEPSFEAEQVYQEELDALLQARGHPGMKKALKARSAAPSACYVC